MVRTGVENPVVSSCIVSVVFGSCFSYVFVACVLWHGFCFDVGFWFVLFGSGLRGEAGWVSRRLRKVHLVLHSLGARARLLRLSFEPCVHFPSPGGNPGAGERQQRPKHVNLISLVVACRSRPSTSFRPCRLQSPGSFEFGPRFLWG